MQSLNIITMSHTAKNENNRHKMKCVNFHGIITHSHLICSILFRDKEVNFELEC